jgi:heavy metal sensor kinase
MKRLPIGVRLTLWYVAIFATAQIVFGGLMYVTLRSHLYDIVDDTLHGETEDLQNFLQAQKPGISVAKMQEEVAEEYGGEHAGEYLELYDQQGDLIFRSEGMGDGSWLKGLPPATTKGITVDHKVGKRPVRFRLSSIAAHGVVYQARIGTPIGEIKETLSAFRRYLWMIAPLLLAVAAGVGYWLSRRALAPVDRLTRAARSIGGSSLSSRLDVAQSGDELQRLAETLNEMLERIEKSFRRITEFTADASHELRTPVSLIRTEAEVALRRSRNPEEYRGALEHILGEAERTTRLLEHLLALARTDAGREFLEFRELNLKAVVQQAVEAWGEAVRSKELSLHHELPEGAVEVRGDEAALRRVVDILLDNSVKYANARGTIRLSLCAAGGSAVISVEDDGIGIPAEEQTKIFERFYRVDKARSRGQGGAGLGLAIANWIVGQHRGTIAVESVAGKGSRFTVRLPEITGKNPLPPVERVGSTVG